MRASRRSIEEHSSCPIGPWYFLFAMKPGWVNDVNIDTIYQGIAHWD